MKALREYRTQNAQVLREYEKKRTALIAHGNKINSLERVIGTFHSRELPLPPLIDCHHSPILH